MNESIHDDEFEGRAHVLDDKLRDTEWLFDFMDLEFDRKEINNMAHGAALATIPNLGPATYMYLFIAEAYSL